METKNANYQPIDCGYFDYMEHYATLKKPITIRYFENEDIVELKHQVIINISGGRNGEYIHVRINGTEQKIRMDKIISVDGVEAANFSSQNCSNK